MLVDLADGVAALDGVTGERRWQYTRPGAGREYTVVTPDGRTALVAFESRTGERYVVLDTVTGEVHHQGPDAGFLAPSGWSRDLPLATELLTDEVFVRIGTSEEVSGRADHLEAVALADGRPLWRWTPPDGCQFRNYAWGSVTTGDRVVVTSVCGAELPEGDLTELRLHGLADSTGEEVWHRVIELPGRGADHSPNIPYGGTMPRAADRSVDGLIAYVPDTDLGLGETENLLLDPADGQEIASTEYGLELFGDRVVLREGEDYVLLDPRTGERTTWQQGGPFTEEPWPCARWEGLGLAEQSVCLNWTPDLTERAQRFAQGGEIPDLLWVGDPSGATEGHIAVDLGGPFSAATQGELDPEWVAVHAGPGAVVVYTRVQLDEDGARHLVGLR